jgi:undecaprenyl-diphosphatase
MLYDLTRMVGNVDAQTVVVLVIGFFTSFISGYFALKYLIILLKREKIHYFAFYCWAVGIFGIFYFS